MMSEAGLDAILKRRELFDAEGKCLACKGKCYFLSNGPYDQRAQCKECRGDGYFEIRSDESCGILALAEFQRRVLRDMADDGKAVAVMEQLRAENEAIKGLVDFLAEEKLKAVDEERRRHYRAQAERPDEAAGGLGRSTGVEVV